MSVEGRKTVRVIVADDHRLYRDSVVRALTETGQIDVVAEADDGRAALEEIERQRPEIAVLDYMLPGLDGLEVTQAVIREGLPTRVLLLSALAETGFACRALEAGVVGYLPKDAHREQIAAAVLRCARNENVRPHDAEPD